MIIDAVSDLHGHYPKLEGGDLLIIAGDLTARNETTDDYVDLIKWHDKIHNKYKKTIFICGNHDTLAEKYGKEILPSFCEYLCDSGAEFEDLKVWGSPWTKRFEGMNPHCMAFTVDTEEELAEKWKLIPEDIDILITHSPPFKCLDKCNNGHVGSISLGYELCRIQPKLHVFGHIHECGGERQLIPMNNKESLICINASHVNERYEPINKAVRVIL